MTWSWLLLASSSASYLVTARITLLKFQTDSSCSGKHSKWNRMFYLWKALEKAAIKGTSKEKLYNEIGLEYLKDRQWMRRLCPFHKIYNLKSPKYLYNLIPSVNRFYDTRNNKNVPSFKCRTKYFRNSSFPNVITEWNKLDINIKSMTSYTAFKNALSSFIRPKHVDTFGIHNPIGLQLLTRLRLGFSHLNEHKFRHNFRDFLNPLCECNLEPKTASHFLLRCHLFQ